MSLYFVVSYRDERDRLTDVARVDGDVKRDALRRVVQALANKLGKRLEVRKTDTAVPHARPAASSSIPRRNPGTAKARDWMPYTDRGRGAYPIVGEFYRDLRGGNESLRKVLELSASRVVLADAAGKRHTLTPAQWKRTAWERLNTDVRTALGVERRFKSNPSKRHAAPKSKRKAKPATKEQAEKMFKKWHQFESTRTVAMKGPRTIPARLVKLGELPEIVYRSDKWTGKKQTYLHKTGTPRPLLCCDPEGKRFFIVGGRMRATARGIIG